MEENRKVLIFEHSHALTNYLIKQWKEIANQSIEANNRFMVALSGGRTPTEFYCKLSGLEDFDLWKKTHIFLVDEHFVAPDHKESNFHMIRENLLNYINIPPENIHPIDTNVENAALAADHYKDTLLHFFKVKEQKLPSFDLILLGVGGDGHTASLFPNQEGIDDPNRLTVPISIDYLENDRISLTLPVINNARHALFLVLGTYKSSIVKEILEGDSRTPASRVKLTEGELTWLLDKDSASKLSYKDKYTHLGEAISI